MTSLQRYTTKARNYLAICGFASILIHAVLFLCGASNQNANNDIKARTLECQNVVIRYKSGEPAIFVSSDDKDFSVLRFFDKKGKTRLLTGIDDRNNAFFDLSNSNGVSNFSFHQIDEGVGLTFWDKDGKSCLSLTNTGTASSLKFHGSPNTFSVSKYHNNATIEFSLTNNDRTIFNATLLANGKLSTASRAD